MITKLTKEQESQLDVYKNKWLKIGLSISETNKQRAEQAIRDAYVMAGLDAPKIIFWAQSPIGLLMTAKLIKETASSKIEIDQVRRQVKNQVWNQVGDQVWRQVKNQVWNQVRDQVRDQVWDQVGRQVVDQVRSQVWNQVRDQVGDQVVNQVGRQVGDQVRSQVRGTSLRKEWSEVYGWGQWDSGWLSFYDFFSKECGLDFCEELRPIMTLSEETGLYLLYKDIAILSEKPVELHRNLDNRLHNPSGPAIKWKDGYEIYALNGIRMSKELAEMNGEKLTKEIILSEPNADIRRELVRKVSNERLIDILGSKTIHEAHGYKLLSIDIGDKRERPFLWMKNPSLGIVHVEGVAPGIKTVEEAIKWRNGLDKEEMPIVLS
jgi:hypothetical protein